MIKQIKGFILITIVLFHYSCDDVFEEDIENDTLQTVAPINNAVVLGNTVQLSWTEVEGANAYRVQVNNNEQGRVLDSLVPALNFNFSVIEGSYEWRVRAENFAFVTAFTPFSSFSLEASDDLSEQLITLQTPSENLTTNLPITIYTWNEINAASTYDFVIVKRTGGDETIVQENVSTNSATVNADVFNEDAEYLWRVRAVNAISNTEFVERSFFLDRTLPNQPSLTAPADEDIITTTMVTFSWLNGTDTGAVTSGITNVIEISTESSFTGNVITQETSNNSLQVELEVANTYFWRVKARDAASNESEYSVVRSVIIN
jgi:hypothetical protein